MSDGSIPLARKSSPAFHNLFHSCLFPLPALCGLFVFLVVAEILPRGLVDDCHKGFEDVALNLRALLHASIESLPVVEAPGRLCLAGCQRKPADRSEEIGICHCFDPFWQRLAEIGAICDAPIDNCANFEKLQTLLHQDIAVFSKKCLLPHQEFAFPISIRYKSFDDIGFGIQD
jgi:hypothetical protein